MRHSCLVFGFGFFLWLCSAGRLSSQVDTGAISGTVRDSAGTLFPGAKIAILQTETGTSLALRTNSEGFYSVPALRPGIYDISASGEGFAVETKTGIEVRVQDRLSIDFTLVPGRVDQVISIPSQASPLQTEDSSIGQLVGRNTMRNLPLNGRNYIQLATLGAGTSPSRRSSERNTFVANGARQMQNTYLLDGIDNKNRIVGIDNSSAQSIEPGIDGVQEFKVQHSSFSAEFGQAAGAVVNVTLKSGTNQFHGSLFEYVRNSFFDARPYFQVNGDSPAFNQNQFGATVGGPVIRDKTFFFFSWQSLRAVSRAPQLAAVPTLQQRAGIFQNPIYDPATVAPGPNGKGYVRAPFPGNYIPQSRWDPLAAALLPLYPLPDLNRSTKYSSNQKESVSNDQLSIRADHDFRSAGAFFVRASFSNDTNLLPAPLPPPANSVINAWPEAHSIAAGYTHFFRANLINEARIGYMETRSRQQIPGSNLNDGYGIKGVTYYPEIHGLPTFAIAGLNTLGTTAPGALPLSATGSSNMPSDKQGRSLQFFENLSWAKARHTLRFGAEVDQATLYANVTLAARPNFGFSGVYTQNPQKRSGSGAAFADFLLGWVNDYAVSTFLRAEVRQRVYAGYLQDNWKILPSLTLDLGLRYELPMPWYETAGRYANFILDPGSPAYGKVLTAAEAGAYGYRNSFANPNYRAFAPRVGFAWQATPKAVIRGGFGLFYGRVDENLGVVYRPTDNPPYVLVTSAVGDQVHKLIGLSEGLPPGALHPENLQGLNLNSWPATMPLPYTLAWNFNIQRQFGDDFTMQVGYVASGGRDLYIMLNVNKPPPGPGAIGPRRPFPYYNSIGAFLPLVRSSYQSAIVQLERRFHTGFSLLAAYTWGHSIDNGAAPSDVADVPPQNSNNLAPERASSNFDVRQRLVVSYIYELPFGRGKPWLTQPGIVRAVLEGWRLAGITAVQTGLPFTPMLAFDSTNTGLLARPDVVPGMPLYPSRRDPAKWFNPSAFAVPAPYTYGSAGRNILLGPGFCSHDIALRRSATIAERYTVELSAEAFNLFNTPQFGLPNNKLGVPATAAITTVVVPERQLQFGLHLRF